MLPQEKCSKLAFEASCAVVAISCWKKLKGLTIKDTTEISYNTGFTIASTKSTLIMTSAYFLNKLFIGCSMEEMNSDGIFSVGFFDTQTLGVAEHETFAAIVFLDFANDICLLQVEESNHASMYFGGLKYEDDKYIKGLTICSVSHPACHNTIQHYIFTMGKMCQRCLPVPSYRLEANCDCLVYDLPMNNGCSGAPVFDCTGSVIAIHSSFDEGLNFGIGLKSIKKALMRYFGLPNKHGVDSTHEVLRLGLEKQMNRRSDSDVVSSDLERKLRHLEIQALFNEVTIGKMLPQEKCSKLAFEASCAVVAIRCWKKLKGLSVKDTSEISYNTGFTIASTKSTLIMTCAYFLNELFIGCSMEEMNSDGIFSVRFFDTQTLGVVEHETFAAIVFLDFANDICLLQVEESNHASMDFGGLKYEDDKYIKGLTICTVSHPACHNTIQHYIFTMGKMCQRCLPVPSYRLEANCDCLVYDLPMNNGCSGAPVFDCTGSVIAIHSSFDEGLNFGIGLKSVKKALIRYFGLPNKHGVDSTHEVLRLGLEKQMNRRSDSDVVSSDLQRKLRHLEIQALFNEHSILSMVPHEECHDLANRASSAIVVLRCWKKLPGSSIKDSSECVSCTGFIINSDETTLIMSCAHFLLEFFGHADMKQIRHKAIISVEFFDTIGEKAAKVEKEILGDVVWISYSRDICFLTVNVGGRESMVFGGPKYEDDRYLKGLVICTVSHPVTHGVIQPYTFTLGRMSQSCVPVPHTLLSRTSHCLVYALPSCLGSSGAPIFDHTGVVIAVHSSYDNDLCFGIGLRSIKWDLMKYFKLTMDYYNKDANEVLRAGLAKQRATKLIV